MGRPTKLTDEAIDRFLRAIAAGAFRETAGRFAGWSPSSVHRYMRGSTPASAAFRDRVLETETELEIRLVGTITRAAFGDPRWAADLLERRFPERWRRRTAADGHEGEAVVHRPGASALVPIDPAFIEMIVPRLLEASDRLHDPTDATTTLGRFLVPAPGSEGDREDPR